MCDKQNIGCADFKFLLALVIVVPLLFGSVHAKEVYTSATELRHAKERVHPPLSREDITRARRGVEAAYRSYGHTGTRPIIGCNAGTLPLNVDFSTYTLDVDGSVIHDNGWPEEQVVKISGFLCKMLPILRDLYGEPFESYTVTYVRNLRYTSSNIFLPLTRTIHSAGQGWYPQLLTHEFVHAFRGRWTLTADPQSYWLYDPKLSGFEEGFAQAVSYEAMNRYLAIHGPDAYVGEALWTSDLEWNYDFKNDESMITEDFWSDSGGTWKYFERYEMAATAIHQLAMVIPNFYQRFNALYYQRLRSQANYRPTREGIIQIMEQLLPKMGLLPTREWIDRQKIFSCAYQFGKKIFLTRDSSRYTNPVFTFHFVETFPNGSEWALYVPAAEDYLFHRLNGAQGRLALKQAWDGRVLFHDVAVSNKTLNHWTDYQVCGINCSPGFGADQVQIFQGTAGNEFMVDHPVILSAPTQSGLYAMQIEFQNPHFSQTPAYDIAYDQTQSSAQTTRYLLTGWPNAQVGQFEIFGGILGVDRGRVELEHSGVPGTVLALEVARGAFAGDAPDAWLDRDFYTHLRISKPGVVTVRYYPIPGQPRHFVDQRVISYGFSGKHQFLFDLCQMFTHVEGNTPVPGCLDRRTPVRPASKR